MIAPVKEVLDTSPQKFIMNYMQFKSFMENVKGNPNVPEVAFAYTNDIQTLSNMIKTICTKLTDRRIKNRCTRITKKLEEFMAKTNKDTMTNPLNLEMQDACNTQDIS